MRYERALERLGALPESGGKMVKKDWLILILLVVVYTVLAYVNLGSTEVPVTQFDLKQADETLEIQLQSEENIKFIKYYAGLGEGSFLLSYSEDGLDFFTVSFSDERKKRQEKDEDIVNHKPRDMYQWNFIPVDFTAKYIGLTVLKTGMKLNELAFCRQDGTPVKIASVKSVNTEDRSNSPEELFDEQDMVQSEHTTYMTDMYFDEVYHGRTALEHIEYIYPYEVTHPPLGKIILGIGIRIFGMNPFGWRFMGTLFGVLTIPLMYIFAKRLFKKTLYAFIAAFLLTFDFMHFTQTRIATIDSYSIFFIMLMYYFMYMYMQQNFNRDGLKKSLLYLGLCGVSFGLGAATKWLCIYAGAGLALLFFYSLWLRYNEYKASLIMLDGGAVEGGEKIDKDIFTKTAESFKRNLALTLLYCVLVFIIIPAGIYVLSYIPYLLVKNRMFAWKDILENQKYMFNYHAYLTTEKPHPFQSRWYTWPLDIRPVFFFQGENMPKGYISNISTMGHPLIWWAGFASVFFILVVKIKRFAKTVLSGGGIFISGAIAGSVSGAFLGVLVCREFFGLGTDIIRLLIVIALGLAGAILGGYIGLITQNGEAFEKGIGFAGIAALSQYLPWLLISRETFIYHYFATVPFMILILTFTIKYFIEKFRCGKTLVFIYLGIVLLLFGMFYPILTGTVIPRAYSDIFLRWLPTWPFY